MSKLNIGIVSGVDLVSIDRIGEMVDRWSNRFLNRCFTSAELRLSSGSIESIAANFAVKEAFAKATGRGLRGFGWRDIELVKGDLNQPSLKLHGNAELLIREQGWTSISVSLSHDSGMAVALVVALKERK